MADALPTSFAQVPAWHAQRAPDAAALRFEGRAWTYAQFAASCDRAAAVLWHAWGVRRGDRVAWLGANHPGQLALLFGLARIGAILLPLNFRLAPAEWDAQVADCTPTLIVHDGQWTDGATQLAARQGLPVHDVASLSGGGASAAPQSDRDAADAPALLVYTSGTTGGPKAAVHTQSNLLANMRIASRMQAMTPRDVVATMLPMFHVGGLCIQTLPALYAGACVELLARFTPEAAFDCLRDARPTLTLQVPATMKALIDHPRWREADLTCLRALWAGSSLLPAPLVEAFHARGVAVCNVYGATETGPFSIALGPEQALAHVGSCGWPAPEVEVRLHEAKNGVGEVLVRGPNVVSHYWPALPACDDAGWFHTGDLAAVAPDGSYTIAGRAKDLIISGGENIHPQEIESVLMQHEVVLECAAFGVPDARWGEAVAVAVVLRDARAASQGEAAQALRTELAAYLAQRVARYKLPRHWFWLEQLPKTALGKLQRQQLARLAQEPAREPGH
jgi:fatty-acyl-CoA synthase